MHELPYGALYQDCIVVVEHWRDAIAHLVTDAHDHRYCCRGSYVVAALLICCCRFVAGVGNGQGCAS
jgi:hypothetical protein